MEFLEYCAEVVFYKVCEYNIVVVTGIVDEHLPKCQKPSFLFFFLPTILPSPRTILSFTTVLICVEIKIILLNILIPNIPEKHITLDINKSINTLIVQLGILYL